MTHTIENSNGQLLDLMQKVKDQAERSKDFIAPTNALQIQTLKSKICILIIILLHFVHHIYLYYTIL